MVPAIKANTAPALDSFRSGNRIDGIVEQAFLVAILARADAIILTPFPHIARHIEKLECIGLFLGDFLRMVGPLDARLNILPITAGSLPK